MQAPDLGWNLITQLNVLQQFFKRIENKGAMGQAVVSPEEIARKGWGLHEACSGSSNQHLNRPKQKVTVVNRGKQQNLLPPVCWLTVVRAWVTSATHFPVTAISLTHRYRAALLRMPQLPPCRPSSVQLGSSPALHWASFTPSWGLWSHQWQLWEACTACPKQAQGLLGNTTFSPTSIITPIFTHFMTLDFLFYFWQFCHHLCFHFQRIIFSSFFPLHLFFLHSVSHFSFPLSPTTCYALETVRFPSSFFLFICGQLLFLTQQFL